MGPPRQGIDVVCDCLLATDCRGDREGGVRRIVALGARRRVQ